MQWAVSGPEPMSRLLCDSRWGALQGTAAERVGPPRGPVFGRLPGSMRMEHSPTKLTNLAQGPLVGRICTGPQPRTLSRFDSDVNSGNMRMEVDL